MVALPLFKLGALFIRHISKYGANRIKIQAHDHPRFRLFAAKYGQMMHQLNMRLSVASMRDVDAEIKAKEKAETPTVKTKEEMEKEQQGHAKKASPITSIWKRKFRPLPEAKAVDLFADVIGDVFILLVATALLIFEYQRSSQKPDATVEKIDSLTERFEELERREKELEKAEQQHQDRTAMLEDVLRRLNDPKTKKPLLPPAPTPIPVISAPAQV
ncbi:hypothetical protein GGR50DRAFT_666888 [Xylaria sp. CBS 124048]|nr:hypothetical protein GGR50DRAFT_666888 [Xylaria sp. CBS 124048]